MFNHLQSHAHIWCQHATSLILTCNRTHTSDVHMPHHWFSHALTPTLIHICTHLLSHSHTNSHNRTCNSCPQSHKQTWCLHWGSCTSNKGLSFSVSFAILHMLSAHIRLNTRLLISMLQLWTDFCRFFTILFDLIFTFYQTEIEWLWCTASLSWDFITRTKQFWTIPDV